MEIFAFPNGYFYRQVSNSLCHTVTTVVNSISIKNCLNVQWVCACNANELKFAHEKAFDNY